MAKANQTKKAEPKPAKVIKADVGLVTQLVAAHIAAHGTAPKDVTPYVQLAADIDTLSAGGTLEDEEDD